MNGRMVKLLALGRSGALILASIGALAGLAQHAAAADLGLRGAQLPPEPLLPAALPYDWTGFHVGVEGGWARAGKQSARSTGTTPTDQLIIDTGNIGTIGFSQSGYMVGGGIGYDLQPLAGTGLVVGGAADVLYSDVTAVRTAAFNFAGNAIDVAATQRLDWLGTVRGRLGYAFGNVLVYGTGGFAFGSVDLRASVRFNDIPYDSGRYNGIETGYVYGGGVEFGLPNLSLPFFNRASFKVEYLRYDLGSRNVPLNAEGPVFGPAGLNLGQTGDTRFQTRGQVLKAGLNVKLY